MNTFLKKWISCNFVCHTLDQTLVGSGRNARAHVPGNEYSINTEFRKHSSSGSVVKTDYVFPYLYMHKYTPPSYPYINA